MSNEALSQVFANDTLVLPNAALPDSSIEEEEIGIEDQVFYFGKDSTIMDLESEKIYLYGMDSYVKYGDLEVKAALIVFSFAEYTAFAKGVPDSTGKLVGRPVFKDATTQFEEDSLGYNFKTKAGISYGVRTQEGDAWLLSGVSKRQSNGWINVKNGRFTTCDAENPHYHFRLSKAIVVPDDKVVSGPLYMKVRKVPMPLALPFGFFPNKKESTHGIILPGYGNGQQKGFFIQNLGYYIPFQPYFDTKFLFDIYTRGSWQIANQTGYKKRYKYTGSFRLSRAVNKNGEPGTVNYSENKNFNVQWTHNQDAKARPNTSFAASVNLGSSQNFRNTLNASQENFLTSTFTSNVRYGKTFAGTPFTMSLEARHTQNVQTRQVDMNIPSLVLNMQRINLLETIFPKSPIGLNGSLNINNTLSAKEYDIQLANLGKLTNQLKTGARANTNLSTSWKLGPYLTVNPSLTANGYLGIRQVSERFDSDLGRTVLDTIPGMIVAGTWSTQVNMNTRIYGTFTNKGNARIKALRHMIQPTVGLSYTPYAQFQRFGFYSNDGEFMGYSPWDASAFQPGTTNEAGSVNFSVNQNLEMKVRDKSSAKVAYKKVKLIESFKTAFNYNMLADSLNLGNMSISAFTTIREGVTVTYNSTHSFYDRDSLGREVNQFLSQTQNRFSRLEGANLAFTFGYSGGQGNSQAAAQQVSSGRDGLNQDQMQVVDQNRTQFVDFSVPWRINVSYNLRLSKAWQTELQADENTITQTVAFNGDVRIMQRWVFTYNCNYDLKEGKFTTSTLGLTWDLHCWELSANFVPVGERKSYFVQLNIKSPLLQDLKIQRRGNLGDDTLLY